MDKIKLVYDASDNGNCRVYYRRVTPATLGARRKLYCLQLDDVRNNIFTLLTCTEDGEPECNVASISNYIIPKAEGDESIDREVNQFLNGDFR